MELIRCAWGFMCKWVLWIAYASGIRQWHARGMAWLYDRKFKDVPVRTYPSIEALAQTISEVTSYYRPDGAERLWDSISYPGRFQTFLDNGSPGDETANDCDDFANYIAHALRKSDLPEARNARLLLVFWMKQNYLLNGHAVCLFESPDGKYGYMDYRKPTYRDSIQELAEVITKRYRGIELLLWAELNIDTFHADTVTRN